MTPGAPDGWQRTGLSASTMRPIKCARREQTVVPPYVVRPVEAASASIPLSWDELEGDLRIEDFSPWAS